MNTSQDMAIYKIGGEKWTLLTSYKNTSYYRRIKWREILVSLRQQGCQARKFVNFVIRILCLAFFNEFVKRIMKGNFEG